MGNVQIVHDVSKVQVVQSYKNLMGAGTYGKVYKSKYGFQRIAVKLIDIHRTREYSETDMNAEEKFPFLTSLHHQNLAQIYDLKYMGHELRIAMELCTTNIAVYANRTGVTDMDVGNALWQGCKGLTFLHQKHVIHRGVKPTNILVIIRKDAPVIAKITDICFAKNNEVIETMSTLGGSTTWYAPELVTAWGQPDTGVKFSMQNDVFSFGMVVLYTCLNHKGRVRLTGRVFGSDVKNGNDIFEIIGDKWNSMEQTEKLLPMMRMMLQLEASERPKISTICQQLKELFYKDDLYGITAAESIENNQ